MNPSHRRLAAALAHVGLVSRPVSAAPHDRTRVLEDPAKIPAVESGSR